MTDKFKLVMAANHSFPHVGGTEVVIQNIAESFVNDFDCECTIISRVLIEKKISQNGVEIVKCGIDANAFRDQLVSISPDHVFIYSDCFRYWPDILNSNKFTDSKYSIALVGMNNMLSGNKSLFYKFKRKYNQYNVITHSDNYQDYMYCQDADIPVHVIPNGVSIKEFDVDSSDFRKKHKIDTEKIVLCVSNFFPGKGQEYLLPILDKLYQQRQDFTAVFICSTVNFYVANNIRNKFRQMLKRAKFPSKVISDVARKEVLEAYKEADVFVFPSQKEVAPIVILEAMASGTPWVAMPVGNIGQLKGGKQVPYRSKDAEGFATYNAESNDYFVKYLYDILSDDHLRQQRGDEGRKEIEEKYLWEKIVPIYHELFTLGTKYEATS